MAIIFARRRDAAAAAHLSTGAVTGHAFDDMHGSINRMALRGLSLRSRVCQEDDMSCPAEVIGSRTMAIIFGIA